jgi:UDP:flavonoid glycosyltransferase YjiC (YdhE family)
LSWEPSHPEIELPPGDDPLVLIAPSTAQDPDQRMLRAALAGLAELPVRVLATANRRPLARPVRLPRGATFVNWLSYTQAMPQAALVVCHAGHGTLVRALAAGAPVIAVPHSGDMGENAARLDWSGAGLRLPWRLLSPTTLRLAVTRALHDHATLAARAAELAAWLSAHDPATRAAELIEQLAWADSDALWRPGDEELHPSRPPA